MAATNYNVYDKVNAHVEEAFKVLRSNIQFCSFEKKIKTLNITSTNAGEGKTTVSINLAISMARSGLKVLLVDGDLRKPMLMKRLGSKNITGLSNYISGYAELDEIISDTSVNELSFVSSGSKPPNPSELLGAPRFKEFLETTADKFDLVIVDSPPLGSVIDSALIASVTDGTLLVIESKKTDHKAVQNVKEQLEKANSRIIGVVLNKIEKSDYKHYYGYDDYYYYDGVTNKNKKKFKLPWAKKHSEKVES